MSFLFINLTFNYFHRRANRSLADPERAAKKISKDSEHGSPQGNYFILLLLYSVYILYKIRCLIWCVAFADLDDEHAGRKELDVKCEPYSPWGATCDRDTHGLRADSPLGSDPRDMYSSEQLVPGHNTYQPSRYLLTPKHHITLRSLISLLMLSSHFCPTDFTNMANPPLRRPAWAAVAAVPADPALSLACLMSPPSPIKTASHPPPSSASPHALLIPLRDTRTTREYWTWPSLRPSQVCWATILSTPPTVPNSLWVSGAERHPPSTPRRHLLHIITYPLNTAARLSITAITTATWGTGASTHCSLTRAGEELKCMELNEDLDDGARYPRVPDEHWVNVIRWHWVNLDLTK